MLKLIRLGYFYLALVGTALFSLPVFFIRPFDPKNTSLFFSLFSRAVYRPMGLKYREIDKKNFFNNRPSVLVGNHQHNFDTMVASLALEKHAVFLGKKELLRIPFLGLCFYLGGNVLVDRSDKTKARKSMEKVRRKLKEQNLSVVIFPEGTRNKEADLLTFKRGAFATAIETGLPIVPFAVSQYGRTMNLNKLSSGKITVKFLDPIPTESLNLEDAPKLAEQTRQAITDAIAGMEARGDS